MNIHEVSQPYIYIYNHIPSLGFFEDSIFYLLQDGFSSPWIVQPNCPDRIRAAQA